MPSARTGSDVGILLTLAAHGAPPSVGTLMVCVSDIHQARKQLVDAGGDVSEVDEQAWGHFVYFDDPDGNHWNVQYLPYRYQS